jgi:hypothetical protein
VTTEYRTSDRKLNTMKVSKVLPYKNTDIYKLLNANQYRQSYDVNIAQNYTMKRICANCTIIYQQSKKIIIVSPRDFVLVLFAH